MKLIDMKCPNCKAALKVNEDLEMVMCNYCGNIIKIEDENETKEERVIKAVGKQKEKERKYYASEDYKKKLDYEANASDKSFIGSIGRQIQKGREYYSSDEYKKRLEIQREELKNSFKIVGVVFGSLFGILIISLIISSIAGNKSSLDFTCTLNEKEYVIVLDDVKGLSCASCDDNMLDELKDKYVVENNIQLSKKNVISYFKNQKGSCKN